MVDSISPWGKGMRSFGREISPLEMQEAFDLWDAAGGYMHLALCLRKVQPNIGGHGDASWHLADRMIQKARKAGMIRLGPERKWEKCKEEPNA